VVPVLTDFAVAGAMTKSYGNRGGDGLDGGAGANDNDGGGGTDTCLNHDSAPGAVNCQQP
jgi:hypothetical protein